MQPYLGAGEIDIAVMSLVYLVGVVELAEMLSLAVFVVRCRMGVEIAHAEVWTAACLNCSSVDRPVRSRRRRMTRADAEQGDHENKSHSVHRSTPLRDSMHLRKSWRKRYGRWGASGPSAELSPPARPRQPLPAWRRAIGGDQLFREGKSWRRRRCQ